MQTATIIINCKALQHNLRHLRKLVPTSKLISVVKANAYGHGLLKTAQTIYDTDAFAVARLEEALNLRDGGIVQPILLLEGFSEITDLLIISKQRLDVIIHNEEQLCALEKISLSKPITVWMKLDTGMHRLGIRPEVADIFYQRLCQCNNVRQPVNIISHLSCSYKSKCKITERQLNIFNFFCSNKPGMRSIAASRGILLCPESHFDWVRPGIILYGISPFKNKPWGLDLGFQPVMSLISYLIAVRKHKAGEPVGYGGTWISERDTYIGVAAIGYGDGYPQTAPSGTPVLINGHELPIIGNVAMDMICIDLGPQTLNRTGDKVILWGKELPVERIAQETGISAYELIARLTSRVKMIFLE